MSAKDSGVEDLAAVQQRDLGTGVCGLRLDTTTFRTAGLVQARRMLIESVPYVINLPISRLWDSYSPGTHLTEVKAHLVERGILSEEGDWVNVDREDFDSRGSGRREDKVFEFFSDLFNVVLEYLKQRGAVTAVQTMVNAGFVGPESTRISTNRPDAYVQVTSPTGGGLIWRKVVSPFEYKFGDGDRNDNDTKLFWSLYHTMRSDPRRNFALGVTILGTTFRVWLLCRAAPFTFTPFNWFERPDSLLKVIILLVKSSREDLGFCTNIKSNGGRTDFDVDYTIGISKSWKVCYSLAAPGDQAASLTRAWNELYGLISHF